MRRIIDLTLSLEPGMRGVEIHQAKTLEAEGWNAKRLELYRTAQEIVFRDAPVVPLVHTRQRIVQRANVKGYRLHPATLQRLRQAYFEDAP